MGSIAALRPTFVLTFVLAAAVALSLLPAGASAQWNNEPYRFGSNIGAGTGGAGMSMAYRQAILDEELFGRRPENLLRGADGRLLRVIDRDQQAFLAEPEPNFLVRQGDRLRVVTGIYGLGLGAATPIDRWTGTLNTGAQDWAVTSRSSQPIDAWIGMLD